MRPSILVVEDNRDLAENVRELFEETGVEVTLAFDAEEAEQRMAERPYALALIDVNLPNGSGMELVPKLKASSPHADVVLVTGDASIGSAIEAVRRGVFAYVQKPFDPEDLLALVERALAQVSLRREREELSLELARSEALYRDVVDSVHSLLVGLDREHRVRMWNQRVAELTGVPADEAIGHEAAELLLEPERRASFTAALTGEDRGELMLPLLRRGEGRRVVRWRIVPLAGVSDALALAIGEDVTETLALEARAAEAEAMAVMGRLTAGLAHEIRNPLNAATLQLELISRAARRLDDEVAREHLAGRASIVRAELTRTRQLLDEFLGLARPVELEPAPIDVARLVEELALSQGPLAREAGVELSVEVDPALPPIRGDDGKLKQALMNLMVNAIDAMRERGHGTILLAARRASSALELSVEDDGPGLPDHEAGELFRAFFTTKETGTGLGLSLVKQVIEQHGGKVELRARVGGGTVATLTIPEAR